MSLKSIAQSILLVEENVPVEKEHDFLESLQDGPLEVILEDMPLENIEHENDHEHEHEHNEHEHYEDELEIAESPDELLEVDDLSLTDLPGAPSNTPEPQEPVQLEVTDENSAVEIDENDAKKAKRNEKWDWQSKGATGFIDWVKERFSAVPKHSGYDSAGLERAKSYLEKLDDEISKAMRLDLDGELDADKIEKVRSQIDDGISRIQNRLDKVIKVKKNKRKKSKAENIEDVIIKEAQKITGVQGIYVTVPLLISRIARLCINGMVSAGKDIEELISDQIKKYSLNIREQSELIGLLEDMGYTVRRDRGFLLDENIDPSSSDNFEWMQQFKG